MQTSSYYPNFPALPSRMSPARSHLAKRSGRVFVVQLIPFNREPSVLLTIPLRILHASLKSRNKLSLLLTKHTTEQLEHSRQRRIFVLQPYIHVVDGLLGQTAVEVAASMSCSLTVTEFPRGQKGLLSSEGVIPFNAFGTLVGELLPRLDWLVKAELGARNVIQMFLAILQRNLEEVVPAVSIVVRSQCF